MKQNMKRSTTRDTPQSLSSSNSKSEEPQIFHGEWDDEGVYVYQAYNDAIADWALEHQTLGGPQFRVLRMTWFKPSFGWVLCRSGYARKPNQTRILKIKLSHEALAHILTDCECHGAGEHGRLKERKQSSKAFSHHDDNNSVIETNMGKGPDYGRGCIQWDPERDVMTCDPKHRREPRKMLKQRAIQIGVSGSMSTYFVRSAISIQDVTSLAHAVERAHRTANSRQSMTAMEELLPTIPIERPYMPHCTKDVLSRLALIPGPSADAIARIGMGKVELT